MKNCQKIKYMNLKFIFIVLIIATAINESVFAQKPILSDAFTFSFGEKYKNIKSLNTYYVATNSRFLAVKKGRNDMTIQRFNLKDLKEEVKIRQVIEDKGNFETVMDMDGYAVVFYSIKDKAYAQKISLTGSIAQKPIQLINEKENLDEDFGFKSTYGFDAGGRINKFVFKRSPDGKKVLLLYRLKSSSDSADKIGIAVFDSEIELLWKKKITMPYSSNKMLYEDFTIDNIGNFYMTSSVFNDNSTDKNKLESFFVTELYKIKEDSDEILKSTISISSGSIMDAVISNDASGKVMISGFYSNNNEGLVTGVFCAKLGNQAEVTSLINSDISSDIIQKYALEREKRIKEGTQKVNDEKDFEKLKINDVLFNPDGSIVLLGEQRYAVSFTTSSSSGSRTTYDYFYRDIYAFKLSSDGKLRWMHKLPKNQRGTTGKNSMSYKSFRNSGKHYMFFIDNFTNLKRSFDESPTKYFDGKKDFLYLTAYVIDDVTGEVIKEPILTSSDIRNSRLDKLEVSKLVKLPNKDMVIEAFDGKKNNLLLKISVAK